MYFDLVADKIHQVHLSGGKILVYCRAGQSRSATLCIAYFMKYHSMTYEEAFQFVKQCRPIIHPNIGFIRQLKEFEVKCRTRLSVSSLAIATTPAGVRKVTQPLIPFLLPVVATCEVIEENDWEDVEEVAVRPPKPRRSCYVLHEPFCDVAEQLDSQALLSCQLDIQVNLRIEKSLPSGCIQEVHPVVSQELRDLLLEQTEEQSTHTSSKLRSAFSRLCRPAQSAVSYMNLILEISESTNTFHQLLRSKAELSSDSSGLLEAPVIFQEVPSECLAVLSSPIQTLPRPPCLSLPTQPRPTVKNLRPHGRTHALPISTDEPSLQITMVPLLTCATSFCIEVLNNTGSSSTKQPNKPLQQGLVRTMSMSSRVAPSRLLFQPKQRRPPDKANSSGIKGTLSRQEQVKRKANVIVVEPQLICALISPKAVVMETIILQQRLSDQQLKVRITVIDEPALITLLVRGLECEGETVSCSIAHLRQRLGCSLEIPDSGLVAIQQMDFLLSKEDQVSSAKRSLGHPAKEFPYYSTTRYNSAVQLFRAKEEVKLKALWYRDTTPVASKNTDNKPIYMAKTISQLVKGSPKEIGGLQWAASHYLDEQKEVISPLQHVQWNLEKVTQHIHYACQVLQPPVVERAQLLGQFYVPHYTPALLRRDCDTPWKVVAETELPMVLSMQNLYSNPRTFGLHAQGGHVVRNQEDLMAVAINNMADLRQDESVEVIPDEIHDFNEIKQLLAHNCDSTKCNIWFDVFKRTLIRMRPTYPCWDFVMPLQVPAILWSELLMEGPVPFIIGSYPKETAVAKYLLDCDAKPVATNWEADIKEMCTGFTSILEIRLHPQPYLTKVSLKDNCLQVFIPQCCDVVRSYGGRADLLTASKQEWTTSSVSFPNKLYSVSEPYVLGMAKPLELNQLLLKTAFQRLAGLHPVVSQQQSIMLSSAAGLPGYQYVQDVEDWPDLLVSATEIGEMATTSQVDCLWFFALDSVPACHGQEEKNQPQNFLLFLPDPETVERLGQEELNSEVGAVNPGHLVAELLQEMRINSIPLVTPEQDRREVAFLSEANDRGSESSRPSRHQKVKTLYYGRDRSKSRARLKDVPLGRNASFRTNEAEVMRNLARSVTESRDILARRRANNCPASPMAGRREDDYLSPALRRREYLEEALSSVATSPRLSRREEEELESEYRSPPPVRTQRRRREEERYSPESYTNRKLEMGPPAGASGGLYGILSLATNLFRGVPVKDKSPRPLGGQRNRNY